MKSSKSYYKLSAVLIFAAILSACEKFAIPGTTITRIAVNVSTAKALTTKASDCQLVDIIKSESGDFILEEYVSEDGFIVESGTKGAVITTNANNPITAKTINMEGWFHSDIDEASGASPEDKANHHFVNGETITYSGTVWNTTGTNYWRNGINTSFRSYVSPSVGTLDIEWPSNKPDDDSALSQLYFDYTLPEAGNVNDAASLEDFLFAYNMEKCSIDANTGTVSEGNPAINIKLYHPLAAVKFDVGSLNGSTSAGASDYVDITKVELINVPDGGYFCAIGTPGIGVSFGCTPNTTRTTFAQSANVTRANIENGMFTGNSSGYVFFMIPTDLTGVKAKVTFTKRAKAGDPLQTVTRTVPLTGSWESGKYYTYKINAWINVLGEELYFDNPSDESGNPITGSVSFDSRSATAEDKYIQNINLSGVKYIKMTWTQSWKNPDKASVAQMYLYDPKNKTTITTQNKGSYTYGGTTYNGIYDAKQKNFPTSQSWVFKLDGEFNQVACCFRFLNSGSGGSSSKWTVNSVASIKFEVLELMPDEE